MSAKDTKRQRRAQKTRANIRRKKVERLCVHKTNNHIYAQIISACGAKVLAAASSLEKDIRESVSHGGNQQAADKVGKLIAQRCLKAGVKNVAFDRSGHKFHGRLKVLADAAREAGVIF